MSKYEFNYPVATLAALEQNPARVTLSTTSGGVSNRKLAETVRNYAAHMAACGVSAGTTVAISMRSPIMIFSTCLAAGLLGARWIAAQKALPIEALGETVLLYADSPPPLSHVIKSFPVDRFWSVPPAGFAPSELLGFSAPSDIAYFARSSGTTGSYKFMPKTCQHMVGRAEAESIAGFQAIAILSPAIASLSFRSMVGAALAGVRVVVPGGGGDRKIGEAAALQRAGVEYVSGSPVQVDGLCAGLDPLEQRIPYLRVGGAVMDHRAIRHWLGFFEEVILTYGAREGAGGGDCRLRAVDDDTEIAYTLRPDCNVQVVSDRGEEVPHSTVGELRFRSPGMVSGYVGAPEATAEVFRDGWFYPGDQGMLLPDGRFKVLGRTRDRLNLGGVKLNAADIDEAARQVPGVNDALCFTVANAHGMEELYVAVVPTGETDEAQVAEGIRRACQGMNNSIRVQSVYFVPAIPINDNGKRMRRSLPELVVSATKY
ncbi:MAG: AMP-binding protein [Devosia sp.]